MGRRSGARRHAGEARSALAAGVRVGVRQARRYAGDGSGRRRGVVGVLTGRLQRAAGRCHRGVRAEVGECVQQGFDEVEEDVGQEGAEKIAVEVPTHALPDPGEAVR
ncbi:MAG TPA: hypothetical protein VHS58_20845 [Acetobacteraceae bacterium]|nr:hypothetical protein [Acetobacteraceae bacterium]